jgi:hypothetical protein
MYIILIIINKLKPHCHIITDVIGLFLVVNTRIDLSDKTVVDMGSTIASFLCPANVEKIIR